KCRRGYVRELRHGKKRCITATTTEVYAFRLRCLRHGGCRPANTNGAVRNLSISALVTYSYHPAGYPKSPELLFGVPIAFTIKDATSGATLASFTMEAQLGECVLVKASEGATVTYLGQAYPHSPPACPLPRVSVPASDRVTLVGRFAGKANYAPS